MTAHHLSQFIRRW